MAKSEKAVGAPIGGIFLLFLGIVFLLQTFNVLPWSLWGTLWRFWPALLIIAGLSILFRDRVWLVTLLTIAILGASLGLAILQHRQSTSGVSTQSYSVPLGAMQSARVEVDFAAGSLTIRDLPSGSADLVKLEYEVRNGLKTMNIDFLQTGNEGQLRLTIPGQPFGGRSGIMWKVAVARNVPITLNIKSAASNVYLELVQSKISELRLDIDASNGKLVMPSLGTTRAFIKSDVTNLEIEIPRDVAARISLDTSITSTEVDKRFPKRGDLYVSDNFDTASNRLELEIDADVGRVQIR
ncbi:MAG: hypothetical protein HY665_07370 [Chloroflexi bacterium]|nr:hypothetical protein [Chloroflexota bacterium]